MEAWLLPADKAGSVGAIVEELRDALAEVCVEEGGGTFIFSYLKVSTFKIDPVHLDYVAHVDTTCIS